jgi:hypothetical protein
MTCTFTLADVVNPEYIKNSEAREKYQALAISGRVDPNDMRADRIDNLRDGADPGHWTDLTVDKVLIGDSMIGRTSGRVYDYWVFKLNRVKY